MLIRLYRAMAAAAIVSTLAGCATTQQTPEKYKAISTALEGSASLRAKTIAQCNQRKWPKQTIESMALVLDVSESRAVPLFCQRTVNAVAFGKLTYEDLEKTQRGEITAKVVRVMQGR